jgi:hypothetical protein
MEMGEANSAQLLEAAEKKDGLVVCLASLEQINQLVLPGAFVWSRPWEQIK